MVEDDQRFAKALQTLMGADEPQGLATELSASASPWKSLSLGGLMTLVIFPGMSPL